eukprot:734471-Karenia_brevis.AAC.1
MDFTSLQFKVSELHVQQYLEKAPPIVLASFTTSPLSLISSASAHSAKSVVRLLKEFACETS